MLNVDSNNRDQAIRLLPRYVALWVGLIATFFYGILIVAAILRSTNSTAGIGFIILPFILIIIFVLFAFFAYCLGIIIQGILDRTYLYKLRTFLAVLILVPALIYFITQNLEIYATYQAVNRISHMTTSELNANFNNRPKHTFHGYDIFILAAIANNDNASGPLLNKIAHLDDPRIYDTLGSIYNLNKGNEKGLSVIRLVEQNPNVDLDTLIYMSNLNDPNILGDLAANPKLPVNVLRELYKKSQSSEQGYLIEWGLAYNPNTPPDILRALVSKIKNDTGFDPVKNGLMNNPNTPSDLKSSLMN